MKELDDRGKVWLRGQVKPVLAIKLDGRIIVPGLEDESRLNFWVLDGNLCVDICEPEKKLRIARFFSKESQASRPGTLFSGFDKTKHADIMAILPDSEGVVEKRFEGTSFQEVASLDRVDFWKFAQMGEK